MKIGAYTKSIIAMLAVINPLICAIMILQDKKGQDRRTNILEGLKAMGIVLLILLVAAIVGRYVLNAFGISLDAFKIVGGIILGFIGFQMMVGAGGNSFSDEEKGLSRVILFAASPASIAMVVTLAAAQNSYGVPLNAIVGCVTAVIITVITILVLQLFFSKRKFNQTNIGSRFMGMIIAAMGLQFALEGIKKFFL